MWPLPNDTQNIYIPHIYIYIWGEMRRGTGIWRPKRWKRACWRGGALRKLTNSDKSWIKEKIRHLPRGVESRWRDKNQSRGESGNMFVSVFVLACTCMLKCICAPWGRRLWGGHSTDNINVEDFTGVAGGLWNILFCEWSVCLSEACISRKHRYLMGWARERATLHYCALIFQHHKVETKINIFHIFCIINDWCPTGANPVC